MTGFIDYSGKRVVVTGCFSGMGAATARQLLELGAEVHGVDYKESDAPLTAFTSMDLRDPAAIETAAAKIEGPIDALFNCAGVPSTFAPEDVFRVNFAGTRLLTELLLPRLKDGGAISCVASTAGMGWARRIPLLQELVATESYDAAIAWRAANCGEKDDMYSLSKEALIVWVLQQATVLIKRGIRINCILPGPTATPFMEQQGTITPQAVFNAFTQPIGRFSTSDEQASALVFLNSERASYVNGAALAVDGGFTGGVATGRIDLAELLKPRAA